MLCDALKPPGPGLLMMLSIDHSLGFFWVLFFFLFEAREERSEGAEPEEEVEMRLDSRGEADRETRKKMLPQNKKITVRQFRLTSFSGT